jgi:hypothetical protein
MSRRQPPIGTSSPADETGRRGRVSPTSLPPPLPISLEELVVVNIVDGVADTTLVHLPAHRRCVGGAGGPTFDRFEFSPAVWPSAGRLVDNGFVYVRAGLLEGAPVCAVCEGAP